VINERCEPLVCVFEVIKAFCKAREYWKLQGQENIKVYLGLETYKGLKESREYEASMLSLIRSKKEIKKPEQPVVSNGLQKLRQKIQ